MKSFFKFILIFSAILLLSAFLAPVLFDILPWRFKFERIFNRLIMIGSIAAAFLFVRIGPQTFRRYGLAGEPGSFQFFLKGFAAGVVTLILLIAVETAGGAVRWAPKPFEAGLYAGGFAKALLTGLVVGLIEEFFFRGFVYCWLRDRWRWPAAAAVCLTSFFYALVHFVSRANPFIGPDPAFKDSLTLISVPFLSLMEWRQFWPEAVGLFLFGVVLNLLVLRTGSLYPAIGLHAGCVFFVKSDTLFVEFVDKHSLVWAGSPMVDGLVSWIFLLFLWPAGVLLFKKRKSYG